MPKRAHRPRRRRAAPQSGTPALRRDPRNLLDRILDTPHLAHVVPRLPPEVLHRVIQSCGLEDCGELVALATPGQLAAGLRSRPVARGPTRPGRAVRRRSLRRVARSADGIRRRLSRRRSSPAWTSIWRSRRSRSTCASSIPRRCRSASTDGEEMPDVGAPDDGPRLRGRRLPDRGQAHRLVGRDRRAC